MLKLKKIYTTGLSLCAILTAFYPAVFAAASADSVSVRVVVIQGMTAELQIACDTHQWKGELWSGVTPTLQYGEYYGFRSMRASFEVPGPSTLAFIRTYVYFQPEDWSAVTQIKMEVYVESTTEKNIELEIFDSSDVMVVPKPNVTGISTGSWVEVVWDVSSLLGTAFRIVLVPGGLLDGDIMYFKNMRINRGAGDIAWDAFAEDSYAWTGGEDFVPWQATERNDPISNIQTHNASAGALSIPWDVDQDPGSANAKLEAVNLQGKNFTGYSKMRAWVYSDRSGVPIYMAFADGSSWTPTAHIAVDTANNWQLMEWDAPGGVNWTNLQTFMFMVNTFELTGVGQVYIDDIEFGN